MTQTTVLQYEAPCEYFIIDTAHLSDYMLTILSDFGG